MSVIQNIRTAIEANSNMWKTLNLLLLMSVLPFWKKQSTGQASV
jgi:hypothetical protein